MRPHSVDRLNASMIEQKKKNGGVDCIVQCNREVKEAIASSVGNMGEVRASAESSSLASICSRAARSGNPNRPSCGQRSGGTPRSGKGRSRYPSSLFKNAVQLRWTS